MISVPLNEISLLAELCVELTKNGAAYNVTQKGNYWAIAITGY